MLVFSSRQMQAIDKMAIEHIGIPSLVLMENAGKVCFEKLASHFQDLSRISAIILCGRGNNGGDGIVVARHLLVRGCSVKVLFIGEEGALSDDASIERSIYENCGGTWRWVSSETSLKRYRPDILRADIVVDSLLGTGTKRALSGILLSAINLVNSSRAFRFAIDIPSGLSGDSAIPIGESFIADETLALQYPKLPHLCPESSQFCGNVIVQDIGIPVSALSGIKPILITIDNEYASSLIKERKPTTHKSDLGKILLVCGSAGKAGAAILSGLGALRGGGGLVTIACPTSIKNAIVSAVPEVMTLSLPEDEDGAIAKSASEIILDSSDSYDAIGVGPGITTGNGARRAVKALIEELNKPLVMDADALNILSKAPAMLEKRKSSTVLTPHVGEWARILGTSTSDIVKNRYEKITPFASHYKVWVHLKGYRGLIASPDGDLMMNMSGGPHLAGPGMGDVLTGIITAMAARRNMNKAVPLAVFIHALAGDIAYEKKGGYAILAREVARNIPYAYARLKKWKLS